MLRCVLQVLQLFNGVSLEKQTEIDRWISKAEVMLLKCTHTAGKRGNAFTITVWFEDVWGKFIVGSSLYHFSFLSNFQDWWDAKTAIVSSKQKSEEGR